MIIERERGEGSSEKMILLDKMKGQEKGES